jgi:hypothetical protein
MHLRKLQAALRRIDSHIRTTAVQEPAHGSLNEYCCISYQPALPRIPARLTPFGQSSGTNVVGDWGGALDLETFHDSDGTLTLTAQSHSCEVGQIL